MTDPRDLSSFNELDRHETTFKSSGLSHSDAPTGGIPENPGSAVSLLSNGTVSKGSAGDRLFGKVVKYESDGRVTVADRGYMKLVYTGTPPTVGHSVECQGNGTVRVATGNNVDRGNTVVEVDGAKVTCTIRLN